MHPSARILIAILSALALPGLSFFYLLVLSALLLLANLAEPRRSWRLLWRSRWLLLGILLLHAFQLPGPALFEAWVWGPSRPGIEAGTMQAWRLAAMVLLIDLLVLRLPAAALLSGLFTLLLPLKAFGLPVERVTVRLGLTLHALAKLGQAKPPGISWAAVEASASELPIGLAVQHQAWRAGDSVLVFAVFGIALWL